MIKNATQLKDRIKNINKHGSVQAQVYLRIFMMEHILERISRSEYRDNFILKGGMLVSALVGVDMRSTMDIDTTIRSFSLDESTTTKILNDIFSIDIGDNIIYKVVKVSSIMEDHQYEGLRYIIEGRLDRLKQRVKIDISTGDAITPSAIEYSYKLLLEDRKLDLWSYNIETLLAEKLETVMSRGTVNTRMRDFYDIYLLYKLYNDRIDYIDLQNAFLATCTKRNSLDNIPQIQQIIDSLSESSYIVEQWDNYQRNNSYVQGISLENTLSSISELALKCK